MAVMEAIQTMRLEDDCATIKFTGISWDYQHLQMQMSLRCTAPGDNHRIIYMRFGGDWGNDTVDSATNYMRGYCRWGDAYGYSTGSNSYLSPSRMMMDEEDASLYSPSIVDIYDYTNPGKRSTIHFSLLAPQQSSTGSGGELAIGTGLWNNSAGIKTIEIAQQDNDFMHGSMVALYGWKSS